MITVRTLLGYLLGSASAARRVAAHPRALWVGLAFVLAAGLAREYDGEDLLRDPWHLALPLVASLVTSFLLYVTLRVAASPNASEGGGEASRGFFDGYPALLRLYWWTAPLAFLYAVPVEQMMGPAEATSTNLWFLCIVATWRVVLITRAISATWRAPFGAVLFPVMLFADGVAIIMLMVAPLPVFTLMGGVRLTESESVIRNTANMVMVLGVLSGPVWLFGTAIASRWLLKTGLARGAHVPLPGDSPRVSRPLVGVAVLALAVWIPILPITQPPQQRRRAVEDDLLAGRFSKAVARVRGYGRSALPAHWDPPPRPGYGERKPDAVAVLAVALESEAPYWFVSSYIEKVSDAVGMNFLHERREFREDEDREQYDRVVRALTAYPHVKRLASDHNRILRALVERAHGEGDLPDDLERLLGVPRSR